MVVLTIVTQKNGETIFFDEPIPQVHFMKLISCSLYNSWDTLKRENVAILRDENDKPIKVSKIPPGHYNLENFKTLIDGLFGSHYRNQLQAQINTPEGVLQIKNLGGKTITLNEDFAKILGINRDLIELLNIDNWLDLETNVKSIWYPASYFIHCDLIDRKFYFVNNKKSDLLVKIDVGGKAFEKVRYDASPQQPIRDCSTSSHVNSITISVRDQYGELFDFKGLPLEFELELN